MSENNAKNETESKPSQNEDESGTNKSPDIEGCSKTDAVLPDGKNDSQNKEVVIDIHAENANVDNNDANKEYLVYGYYGEQIRPPKTTWVMFQGGGPIPPGGGPPITYDPSSRNVFVRLVFSILLIMILITAVFVGIILFSDGIRDIFKTYGLFIAIPAMILMIGLNYAIACSPCTRMFPCNIICLCLAVIGMSLICGYITVRYRTEIVLYAVCATTIVVLICLLLAFSSFDFTAWLIYIVVIAAAFGAVAMVASLAMLISGTYLKMLHLGILLVGTVINVVILAMELQMVLGGRAVEISEDDYALAAFLLYTSIVDIFLKLVQILGIFDNL